MKQDLVYKDLSYEITGILFEVHNELGRYSNEKQICDLIEKKLAERKLKYKREQIIPSSFEGENKGRNRVDFLVEDKIVLEVKCKRVIEREDYYQLRRYLKALNLKLGFLINFRDRYLKPKRVLNSDSKITD